MPRLSPGAGSKPQRVVKKARPKPGSAKFIGPVKPPPPPKPGSPRFVGPVKPKAKRVVRKKPSPISSPFQHGKVYDPLTRRLEKPRHSAQPKSHGLLHTLGSTLNLVTGAGSQAIHLVYGGKAKKGTSTGRAGSGGQAFVQPVSATIPGKAAKNIGFAFQEAPGKTTVNTLKGFRDSITGIPSAVVHGVVDPKGTFKQVAADYKRRYGPLTQGPKGEKQFRERIKKEGAFAETADAAALVAGGEAAAGRALTKGLKASEPASRAGQVAKAIATEPRKGLRVSGNVVRKQELSPNFFRAARQKGVDVARERVNVRRVAKAEERGARVAPLQPKRGEVVPLRKGAVKRAQRIDVARNKGRALERMRREQAVEVHRGATKAVGKLTPHERRAFKYSMQLGLPADARQAALHLEDRRRQIVSEREAQGTKIPKVLEGTNDELATIDRILAEPGKHFTPKLRAVADQERSRTIRVARTDPGLAPAQRLLRRNVQQAEFLGLARKEGESVPQFIRRVRNEAKRKGLVRPAYFASEKRPSIRYGDYAIGGTKAVVTDKRYTGALFRTGREDTRAEVHAAGVARNIKRKHNWNLVSDNFDRHSFDWGRNKTIAELMDEMDRRGVDPREVAFWNPRKYREARHQFEKTGVDLEHTGVGNEPVAAGVGGGVDAAAVDLKGLATKAEDFKNTSGWSVVPKAVYDEIHKDTRPSSALGRTVEIVKGKQSRLLLGLSPSWLQFQVASNALLTGLAGTGPGDLLKAQAWWKKLSPAERDAVEPYVGIGHFQGDIQQTKLGGSANNQLVNAYRAIKQTPFLQKVGRGNPLDLLFRADNAQNNFFRRAVLYSQIKRDAYRRMGQNIGQAAALESRLSNILTLGPEDQIRAVLRDREAIERHAQHVNDFLGDYTTYTARERRTFGRAVMFYGFLRYSIRFTFWTMPTKHPIMSSIIANLGRLQADEARKILGGDELPWALGRIYWNSNGTLKSIDLSRANPALNPITSFRGLNQVVGFFPPIIGALADQAYSKSAFRDRPWRVHGETQGRPKWGDYSLGTRGRILAEDLLGILPPYRIAEQARFKGAPQGDESMLFSPRPTHYKRADIVQSIEANKAKQPSAGQTVIEQLLPFIPRRDITPEVAASIRQRQGKKVKKAKTTGGVFHGGTGAGSTSVWGGGTGGSTSVWGGGP